MLVEPGWHDRNGAGPHLFNIAPRDPHLLVDAGREKQFVGRLASQQAVVGFAIAGRDSDWLEAAHEAALGNTIASRRSRSARTEPIRVRSGPTFPPPIADRMTRVTGSLFTVKNELTPADIADRKRCQELLEPFLLPGRIDIETGVESFGLFLHVGSVFGQVSLDRVDTQARERRRRCESSNELQTQQLVRRLLECEQQPVDFQRPGSPHRTSQIRELLHAEPGSRQHVGRGCSVGDCPVAIELIDEKCEEFLIGFVQSAWHGREGGEAKVGGVLTVSGDPEQSARQIAGFLLGDRQGRVASPRPARSSGVAGSRSKTLAIASIHMRGTGFRPQTRPGHGLQTASPSQCVAPLYRAVG